MSEETKNPERQPTNSTPEGNGGQGNEKLFTQEEVNRIVSERLARERTKQETPDEREQALNARETRLTCREYLAEVGESSVLLDVLDTSDPERFKAAVAALQSNYQRRQKATGLSFNSGGSDWTGKATGLSHQNAHSVGGGDMISDAFKPKGR